MYMSRIWQGKTAPQHTLIAEPKIQNTFKKIEYRSQRTELNLT